MAWMQWQPYVPVAQRRANALREMASLRKNGKRIQPVEIEGRKIARSFWGKAWCDHLESFSDFANRLPRGRTYVRNGSVCHLDIRSGRVEAIVSGSELYNISIRIKKLKPATWKSVKQRCAGRIGSMLELLKGRFSDEVMTVVTDNRQGLFPQPGEIELQCDCPDWAVMCKHVAAVLYGVGSRLDADPESLFRLRGLDARELISTELSIPAAAGGDGRIDDDALGDIFGIDLVVERPSEPIADGARKNGRRLAKRSTLITTKNQGSPAANGRNLTSRDRRKKRKKSARSGSAVRQRMNGIKRGTVTRTKLGDAVPRIRPTGKSVARLRRRLRVTAAEFARRLGVSAATVSRWESVTGRLKLQARPLAALAKLQRELI